MSQPRVPPADEQGHNVGNVSLPGPRQIGLLALEFVEREGGEQDSCGSHRYEDMYNLRTDPTPGMSVVHGEQPHHIGSATHTQVCAMCDGFFSSLKMHRLPCGHWRCRDCLRLSVTDIVEHIKTQWKSHIVQNLTQWVRDGDYEARDRAFEAAGFYCCGMDMRLDRFMTCMDRLVAKDFFILLDLMISQPFPATPHCWDGQTVVP